MYTACIQYNQPSIIQFLLRVNQWTDQAWHSLVHLDVLADAEGLGFVFAQDNTLQAFRDDRANQGFIGGAFIPDTNYFVSQY